jgi:cell division protein FtsW
VAGDSIFAVISEELGMIGGIALVVAFLAFLWKTLQIGNTAPDRFGKYVATGVGVWITLQALINIGSMVAIMPLTGLPLPFVSYGGTSLAVSLCAVGVVLNISKHRKGS